MRKIAPLVLILAWGSLAPAAAEERVLVLDPAATEVAFDLPATGHDVHGLFTLHDGEIRFDPATGAASGEIRVDLGAGVTGNASRDKTMREEVLETGRFPLARFVARRLEGELRPQGASRVELRGILDLHGTEHEITLPAEVAIDGPRLIADLSFPIPFVDWGLEDPSILFLRVAKTVSVQIHAAGELRDASGTGAGGD